MYASGMTVPRVPATRMPVRLIFSSTVSAATEPTVRSRRTLVTATPTPRFIGPSERLLNHVVGSGEERWWDRQPKRRRGFEVYHELELGGLLDRKVGRLSALQDLVDEVGGPPEQVGHIRPVGHQSPDIDRPARCVYGGQPTRRRASRHAPFM